MYILTDSNNTVVSFPYSVEQLRSDNPQTSFSSNMSEEELAEWNVYLVTDQAPPDFDERTESIEISPPTLSSGKWTREWIVTQADQEEIQRRDVVQASIVRTERNRLLSLTDYSQLPDYSGGSANQAAITQFRQQLRDVPQQPGFPWNVVWPTPNIE